MTTVCLILTTLTGALLPDISAADLAHLEQTRLIGNWKVVHGIENGRPMQDHQLEITITLDKFRIELPEQMVVEMQYEVSTTNPRQLDLKTGDDEGKVLAIYKFEKGRLIICAGEEGSPQRPRQFASPVGSDFSLITLERQD